MGNPAAFMYMAQRLGKENRGAITAHLDLPAFLIPVWQVNV